MNDYLLSILLGIIEGLTEFLPVSSTAHLRLAEAMMGINLTDGFWKTYSIVIQLGAILSLPIYFRRRIADFLRSFPGERGWLRHPLTLTVIAFLFTAVPAFLLVKVIGKNLENLFVIGGSLLVGGIAMWIVDHLFADRVHTANMDEMTLLQAVWIGACQTLAAVFPGTSRSMATIAAGQLAGMSRAAALEFSFFLSIPTMAAATGYDLFKFLRQSNAEGAGSMPSGTHGWTVLGIGFVVSFFVAYGVVAWFMKWVERHGFVPFAIYRILLGIAVLAWAFSAKG